MGADRATRALRGLAAALIATGFAMASHAIADGAVPSWGVTALVAAISAPLCIALAGRSLSLPRLAAAVAISQSGYHLAFALGAAPISAPISGPPLAFAAHHPDASALGFALMPPASAPATPAHELLPLAHTMWEHAFAPSMLSAHAVAAVVTTALLFRGEAALLRMALAARLCAAPRWEWLQQGLLAWLPPVSPRPTVHSTDRDELPARQVWPPHAPRRGPPVEYRHVRTAQRRPSTRTTSPSLRISHDQRKLHASRHIFVAAGTPTVA